jgi:hypothetical protein
MVVAVASATSVTVNAPFNPALPAGTTFVAHTITQSIPARRVRADQAFDAKIQNWSSAKVAADFDYGVIAVRNRARKASRSSAMPSPASAAPSPSSTRMATRSPTIPPDPDGGCGRLCLRDSDGSKIVNNQITLDGYGAPRSSIHSSRRATS